MAKKIRASHWDSVEKRTCQCGLSNVLSMFLGFALSLDFLKKNAPRSSWSFFLGGGGAEKSHKFPSNFPQDCPMENQENSSMCFCRVCSEKCFRDSREAPQSWKTKKKSTENQEEVDPPTLENQEEADHFREVLEIPWVRIQRNEVKINEESQKNIQITRFWL